MKKLIALLAVMLLTVTLSAQTSSTSTYKVGKNNELIDIKPVKSEVVSAKTIYTLKINDITYPVYMSSIGKYYIIKQSKTTNTDYKYYIKIEV